VAINCSAYTEDLLEAELFGYKKGAFTGANDGHKGKLLAADRGTLFLDEIGSMSLKMQTKLLKAIEERSFHPLGSDKAETSRFRVISATLEDVQALIKAGKMRFDFFQRIHGLTVELKPLARRKSDVLALIAALGRGGKRLAFTPEAKQRLLAHDWPGNVREVKRFVELLAAGEDGRVGPEAVDRLLRTVRTEGGGAAGFASEEQYRYALENGLTAAVDRFSDELIRRNLDDNGGKKTAVLSDLGISTRLLYAALARMRGESSQS
jgi:two-component system response regulator HydG